MIHILGIRPFQAQSLPSQNRMLKSRTGQDRAGQGRAVRQTLYVSVN